MDIDNDEFSDEYDDCIRDRDASQKTNFREQTRSRMKENYQHPQSEDPENQDLCSKNEDLDDVRKPPKYGLESGRIRLSKKKSRRKGKRRNTTYQQIPNKSNKLVNDDEKNRRPLNDEDDGESFADEYDYRDERKPKKDFLLARNGVVELTIMVTIFLFAVFLVVFLNINKHKPRNDKFSMTVEIPVDNLKELCDVSNISTDRGRGQCEKACQSARCCLGSGDESCFIQYEDICGMYAPCGMLHNEVEGGNDEDIQVAPVDNFIPHPPKDIDDICSDYSLEDVKGYIACDKVCRSARCCFDEYTSITFGLQSCKDSHHQICRLYDSCNLLNEAGKKDASSLNIVSQKCDKSLVIQNENQRKECKDICEKRSCCFSQTDNCRSANKEWCEEFHPCEVLFHQNSFEIQAPVEISDQCKHVNMLNTHGLEICTEMCKKASCCMYDHMQCDHVNCANYEYCDAVNVAAKNIALQEPNDINQIDAFNLIDMPADLACSDISNESGRNDCIFVCKDTKCCFDESENGCKNNKACIHYSVCRKVFDYLD